MIGLLPEKRVQESRSYGNRGFTDTVMDRVSFMSHIQPMSSRDKFRDVKGK